MGKKRKNNKKQIKLLIYTIVLILSIISYFYLPSSDIENISNTIISTSNTTSVSIEEIPEYTGEIYVTLNNNVPNFEEKDYKAKGFEKYSDLDNLGRCGVA